MALEIDSEYYADLWINSHESCPGWDMPPDPAFADSYLGNGYYPTWCADVTRRRLARAAIDPRYGYGETILTFWPWPARDFEGRNDCVREVRVDDTGDGLPDRTITLPMPILHFLGLLNRMQDRFLVLPEQTVEGHVVSGFASRVDSRWYVLVYAHQMLDTQSRSGQQFDVTLELGGLPAGQLPRASTVSTSSTTRISSPHAVCATNPTRGSIRRQRSGEQFQAAMRRLESPDRQTRFAALDEIERLDVAGNWVLMALFEFFQQHDEPELRERAIQLAQRISAPRAHPAAEIEKIEALAQLQRTRTEQHQVSDEGRLKLRTVLDGNAASFWQIAEDSSR
jgi:hypothetical protein